MILVTEHWNVCTVFSVVHKVVTGSMCCLLIDIPVSNEVCNFVVLLEIVVCNHIDVVIVCRRLTIMITRLKNQHLM